MNLGMRPGVEIGRMLSELLEYVIDNPEKNDKKILCNYVKKKISQRNKNCLIGKKKRKVIIALCRSYIRESYNVENRGQL